MRSVVYVPINFRNGEAKSIYNRRVQIARVYSIYL